MSGLIWIKTVDTLLQFLREFLEKKNEFEKNQQMTKSINLKEFIFRDIYEGLDGGLVFTIH